MDIIVGSLLGLTWAALIGTMIAASIVDIKAWSRDYDIRKAADTKGLAAATEKARKSKFRYASGAWL